MICSELKDFLKEHHISYETIRHTPTYTAQETAASAHIPGKELAKAVIVKLDGKLAMVVEPASIKVDLKELKKKAKAKKVQLASEYEFEEKFPHCEVGAMPIFGNLWDMDVYVEKSLAEDEEIAFNGGSHAELVKLAYEDFKKWAKPKTLH